MTVTPVSRNCSCCAASAGDKPISRSRSWSRTKCSRRHALAPIAVHLTHAGIGAHHRLNLVGDAAQNLRVRPRHAERHRKGRIRSEHELGDPQPRLRRKTLGDFLPEPQLERFARFGIGGQDDDLGEGGVGQLRRHSEKEAGRALADVAGDDLRFRLLLEPGLDLGDGIRGRLDAAALGHLHLDQNFRTVGGREELLLHRAHSRPGDQKDRHHRAGDEELAAHRPGDHAAQTAITGRRVDRVVPPWRPA